jgi:hypothetical protein
VELDRSPLTFTNTGRARSRHLSRFVCPR